MKILFSAILLFCWSGVKASTYEYGELFFVDQGKHEHSNLQILGTMISDNNLLDSYGLLINKSLVTSTLYKLSVEATFRSTNLTDSAKALGASSTVGQKVNQPTTGFHLVNSLLFLKAKSNILNKYFQDLQFYLDLGLGATQYKEQTFDTSTPFSLYGGLTLEIPLEKISLIGKFRRISDNAFATEKFNYNEVMFGAGFRW